MFDIYESHDYTPHIFDNMQMEISDIDSDISADIDNLLANRFDSLYTKDIFRKKSIHIEIIYPRIQYSQFKVLRKSPNYIRFLLSLYPCMDDLANISKIVLRPKHVVLADVELMALYLHKKKILVIYLHQPHFYSLKTSRFAQFAELTPAVMNLLHNRVIQQKQDVNEPYLIPPLWYMLSIIEAKDDTHVDKFLLRCNIPSTIQLALDEISFFYGRHGY